jgi:ABC-type multidrug transport system fused ATPase/permease subunit
MATKAISAFIDSSPEPFKTFVGIVWDGLEKASDVSSSTKLLEVLEKIEKIGEESFLEVKEKLSELIQAGATKEDIWELAEKIRTSNELVVGIVIDEVITKLALLKSNLRLFTPLTRFAKGNENCWKDVHFTVREIRSAYDARRPATNDIINSIDQNTGTILYGDSGSGKSMLLKRVMFEEIDNKG